MKLMAYIFLTLFAASTWAMVPVGHYTGRCDQTSSMQYFKKGKKSGKPYVTPGYSLVDITVSQDGKTETYAYKTKLYFKDGPEGGTEYDFNQKVELVQPDLERRTNLSDGSAADYRLEDDGSLTWLKAVEKDGSVIKANGVNNEYVTTDGTLINIQYDDVGATGNIGSDFTGWALSSDKMWCFSKRESH